jgi:hypothetical protein
MTRPVFLHEETRHAARPYRTTKVARNVLCVFVGISLFFVFPLLANELPEARNLILRSLEAGERNEEQLRAYVSRTRSSLKQFETDGSLKSEEIKTFDDVLLDGFHVRKLVAKNNRPLTADDAQKEDARIAKLISQRKRETPEARLRRLADAQEKRDKDRRFSRELLDAFDYQLVGEEILNGRRVWAVDATPHPGYKPKEFKAQIFTHLRGRIWIDQADLLWVKADAKALEPFSIGFSALAKLDQGARLFFEQTRLPDGTWVSTRVGVIANARVAMLKHISIDNLTTSDNFRKVAPETRLHDAKDDF